MGFDFIFSVFGSMTTAGSSGIVAVSRQVRSLSVIESILGVLYLAVMISRLIDAYRPTDSRLQRVPTISSNLLSSGRK